MAQLFPVTEHVATSARHTCHYLACGPEDGIPVIFVHGWPELSLSWRHQLPCIASLGFRAIAPDMRGYGKSAIYPRHEDYALENSVRDMIELLDALGASKAVWVGHDWGSAVVWAIATHHADRCHGVANLCVPYLPGGFALESVLPLVDRRVYPEDKYPFGQWDYQVFYEESFEQATREFEAEIENTVKALFRRGTPEGRGKPSRLATIRQMRGWFGPLRKAPPFPLDEGVISAQDLGVYVEALRRNGFFGPNSWYMNHARNAAYCAQSPNGGVIEMPVLFLHGAYDYTCETMDSPLAQPMRAHCRDLMEAVVHSGHWMAQEQPVAVNASLVRWLAIKLPGLWQPAFRT